MTTNSNDPEVLRAEIEQTRANLSQNVNTLGEAVAPSSIAKRQMDKVTGAAAGVKDKIMGTAQDARHAAGSGPSISDHAADATSTARAKTQGNPLAAGLVALGAGWLIGSLLPASERERAAAVAAKEKAQPLVEQGQALAKESAQRLQPAAQQAADQVKAVASDAAATVKDQGQQSAEQVRASAEQSASTVQAHQQRPDTSM